MTTRLEIATALNAASLALSATEFRPSVLGFGNAWAQGPGHKRVNGFLARTWSIYIVLPAEERAAQQWYDDNITAVWDALKPVVYVDSDEPAIIPAGDDGNGSLYAVIVTAISE